MPLNTQQVATLAARIDAAQLAAGTLAKLTLEFPDLDMPDAYAIQDALRARYLARGDRLVGYKCGLTSRAKMLQMGVDQPGYGFLTSRMWCPDGAVVALSALVHPRVEAEVAFVLGAPLAGECSIADVLAATDYVVPALEVIDSRYEAFKFDLPSVMADNASSARFVIGGRPRPPTAVDLRTLGVVLEKNGAAVALAASAAVMNHPANAVIALARHLAARGERLAPGDIVLSGGITEAISVASGDFMRARVQDLGDVSIRFE